MNDTKAFSLYMMAYLSFGKPPQKSQRLELESMRKHCAKKFDLPFTNFNNLVENGKKYAGDFTIKYAGITRDGCIVTTRECVEYQKKSGNLLLEFRGNWHLVGKISDPDGKRWEQKRPTEIIFHPE